MAEPPFPAPRGMRWSPTRKRFFKLEEAQAKVKQPPMKISSSKRQRQIPPIPPSAFAHPSSSSAFIQRTRSLLPRSSTLRNVAVRLRELRVTSVAQVVSPDEVGPTIELCTSPSYPGRLCVVTSHHLESIPVNSSYVRFQAGEAIWNDSVFGARRSFCWQDDCQSEHRNHQIRLTRRQLTTIGMEPTSDQRMSCLEPEDRILGITHAVPLTGPVVLARWSHSLLELFRWGHSSRSVRRDKSDFLIAALSRDGRYLYAGRRDGQLRRWKCDAVLPPLGEGVIVELPARCDISHTPTKSDDRGETIRRYNGAITSIKCSGEELVVATSSGNLERLDANGILLQSYHHHNSTWSLDLPLAVSLTHRLVAARGQDDVLRTWSLEHPLPVASLKLELHEGNGSGPDRMIFCEGPSVKIALARNAEIWFIE